MNDASDDVVEAFSKGFEGDLRRILGEKYRERPRRTIPASAVGLSLTISDEAIREGIEIDRQHALAATEIHYFD